MGKKCDNSNGRATFAFKCENFFCLSIQLNGDEHEGRHLHNMAGGITSAKRLVLFTATFAKVRLKLVLLRQHNILLCVVKTFLLFKGLVQVMWDLTGGVETSRAQF